MTNDESGELAVYFGPMFSGKTTALLAEVNRLEIAGYKSQIFKPSIDVRDTGVRSRDGKERLAIRLKSSSDLVAQLTTEVNVVALDETQFFDKDIVDVVDYLTKNLGLRVIVSGLPTDFRGEPFGPMPELIAKADRTIQTVAVCTFFRDLGLREKCETPATRTQRLLNGVPADWESEVIQVGDGELYVARCRRHHIVPGRPQWSNLENNDIRN